MPRYFAFLRAINVGGHTVTMAALRGEFEGLGFGGVETFIGSGNVMFTSGSTNAQALERTIAARLERSLGYEVAAFLRTAQEVVALARHKPFPEARVRSAGAFCVGFVARPIDEAAKKALAGLTSDIDEFHVRGREVYWLCAKKQSESKFGNVLFEKTTGIKVTFRGAATVAKLAANAEGQP